MRQKRMHSCCMGMSKAAGRSSSRLANRSIQLARKRNNTENKDFSYSGLVAVGPAFWLG